MNREQTTVRLTLRMSDELEKGIRDAARAMGIPMNQVVISAVSHWAKSRRTDSHNP